MNVSPHAADNPLRRDALQAILNELNRYDTVWIASHIHPDPDAIGSQLALYHFLKRRGKRVEVVNQDDPPRVVQYLPGADKIVHEPTFTAEALVVLDVGDLDRLGDTLKDRLIPTRRALCVDHHATRKPFGDVAAIFPDACATSELIFELIALSGEPLSRDIAECLYAGIIGDTGNFRFSNTSARALAIAAELIRAGVQPHLAYERIYGSRTEGQTRLLGMVLDTLTRTDDGKVAWLTVTREMFRSTNTTLEDVDGFSDYARSVEGVVAVAFFGELEDGRIKVSLRARGNVQVDGVAAKFGGGGHAYAAGCNLTLPMGEAQRQIVDALNELVAG